MSTVSISPTDHVFVLTGAGISAESGLPTFRAEDGLWAGFRVEDVCTPDAWQSQSRRRLGLLFRAPRSGTKGAAQSRAHRPRGTRIATPRPFFPLHAECRRLHERAGSVHLHHMHGELAKSRCERRVRPPARRRSRRLCEPG